MHEATLVAAAVRVAEDAARANGGGRVVGVTLRVGALSGLSPDVVRERFLRAARGSALEGAAIHVLEDDAITDGAQGLTVEGVEVEV